LFPLLLLAINLRMSDVDDKVEGQGRSSISLKSSLSSNTHEFFDALADGSHKSDHTRMKEDGVSNTPSYEKTIYAPSSTYRRSTSNISQEFFNKGGKAADKILGAILDRSPQNLSRVQSPNASVSKQATSKNEKRRKARGRAFQHQRQITKAALTEKLPWYFEALSICIGFCGGIIVLAFILGIVAFCLLSGSAYRPRYGI